MTVLSPREVKSTLGAMRRDWDRRARDNARCYVVNRQIDWTDDEFFASGELPVSDFILSDMNNVCQGRDPKAMRVLEIGCGVARVTRALARLFGEVHGVDLSVLPALVFEMRYEDGAGTQGYWLWFFKRP